MTLIANDMSKRGYMITKDSDLNWFNAPGALAQRTDEDPDIVIYTDCDRMDTPQQGWYVGLQGPEPGYFSLDTIGTWPHLQQTYDWPYRTIADHQGDAFPIVKDIQEAKLNHLHNKNLNVGWDSPEPKGLPDDHILIIVKNSETGWRSTWTRWATICNHLLANDFPVVVKFDPELMLDYKGNPDKSKEADLKGLLAQMDGHVTCYTGLESLHDILPSTRACVFDESIDNLEPFMYGVPVITHGNPPNHLYTKNIYHQHELIPAITEPFNFESQEKWFGWYVTEYLCKDEKSVSKRIDKLLTSKT